MSKFSKVLLEAKCVSKSFPKGEGRLEVLKGVSIQVREGEAVCIVGASGAGKSTLLHVLGTLDLPTLGKVFYDGQDLTKKSAGQLARFRNETMGFVFQFHHLLPEFTAIENVLLPCRVAGLPINEGRQKAEEILNYLGLSQRLDHYPSQLSGGEQQRVAIARALVRSPQVLLADEPTGNLDSKNAQIIQDLFFELKNKWNLTLVVVTHDSSFANRFPRRLELKDGMWV